MLKTIETFKGGSLSSTSLMSHNGQKFVRKTVSLEDEREYGFQRWYSQLKKQQRYNMTHPNLFPNVIRFGKKDAQAYFDMEYLPNAVNAQYFLEHCDSESEVRDFWFSLKKSMKELHSNTMPSSENAIDLYIYEEVERKVEDCMQDPEFLSFLEYKEIVFNGVKVKSLMKGMEKYKSMLKSVYSSDTECLTHGNITLENLLYIPEEKRVIFIDPYEENIIDCPMAEYSQLLQSSSSKYEMFNRGSVEIKGNALICNIPKSKGIDLFNEFLLTFLKEELTHDQYLTVRLLEISQFIRMLPFKLNVDRSKMFFFYGLASYLLHQYELSEKNSRNGA